MKQLFDEMDLEILGETGTCLRSSTANIKITNQPLLDGFV